jgi:hypothetical protein
MATTADQRIAQSRTQGDEQYRELLAYVTGAGSRRASAYDVEQRVFRGVLALGGPAAAVLRESGGGGRPGDRVGWHGVGVSRSAVTRLSVFGARVRAPRSRHLDSRWSTRWTRS